jgi:DNA helicase II / ATP-dependent DNA helicase PcrA
LNLQPSGYERAAFSPRTTQKNSLFFVTINDRSFTINTVDGCIPSDLGVGTTHEIEEERRLLYVAMTRAKDQLHLMVPQRFYTHGQRGMGDRHVYAQRTRFIPGNVAR